MAGNRSEWLVSRALRSRVAASGAGAAAGAGDAVALLAPRENAELSASQVQRLLQMIETELLAMSAEVECVLPYGAGDRLHELLGPP